MGAGNEAENSGSGCCVSHSDTQLILVGKVWLQRLALPSSLRCKHKKSSKPFGSILRFCGHPPFWHCFGWSTDERTNAQNNRSDTKSTLCSN